MTSKEFLLQVRKIRRTSRKYTPRCSETFQVDKNEIITKNIVQRRKSVRDR